MTQRTRSMGVQVPIPTGTTITLKNGTVSYSATSAALCPQSGATKVTSDYVTPHFGTLIRKGAIINNHFSSYFQERNDSTPSTLTVTIANPANPTDLKMAVGNNIRYGPWDLSLISLPSVDISNLSTLAGTEAMAGVAEPEFNAPVFLAEINETFRMIHRPFKALERKFKQHLKSNAYKTYRAKQRSKKFQFLSGGKASDDQGTFDSPRFNRTSVRRAPETEQQTFLKFMGEHWLEYRYGITPLLSDLSDALGLLQKEPTQHPRYTSRATKTATPSPISVVSAYSASDPYCAGTVTSQASRVVTVKAGVLYTHTVDMYSRSNWYPTSIPEAAWEGVPFSFVADWVANVGDYIRAITPKRGVAVLASWTSVKDVRSRAYRVRTSPKSVAGASITGGCNYDFVQNEVVTSRKPWADVGFAYESSVFDLSSVTWRKRCLDVAGFMSSFLPSSKRKL